MDVGQRDEGGRARDRLPRAQPREGHVMPFAAPSACTAPGCHGVKPCPRHPGRSVTSWLHKVASRHARGYGAAWACLRLTILKRDHYRCPCGAVAGRVDHVRPKALGGTDDPSNLRAICLHCDRAKSSREGAAIRGAKRLMGSKSSAILASG